MHAFRAMNTEFATIGLTPAAQAKAESWFADVERRLSRFRPDSELSALNRSTGRPFMASDLLFRALSAAARHYEETGGLFHPYLGGVLADLGYSASFETLAARSAGSGIEAKEPSLPAVEGAPLRLDTRMRSVFLQEGYAVDLGGFAKGWSAEQLAGMLRKEGIRSGAIDAGGDIAVWGAPEAGWEIGVANPFEPAEDLLTLVLRRPAGVATSTTMKRRWADAEGRSRHHLIDPRRLKSGESGLVQVTMIAPTLSEAEVYAKCLLLLGEADGVPWLEARRPAYAYAAVREDRTLLLSRSLQDNFMKGGVPHASAL